MRAARYGAFWQLAENFLFVRFLRKTPIVAGRRSDSKNVSFDPIIIFELFMLRLKLWSCNNQNFRSVPHSIVARHLSGCHLPEGFQLSRSSCRGPWEPAMGSVAVIRRDPMCTDATPRRSLAAMGRNFIATRDRTGIIEEL